MAMKSFLLKMAAVFVAAQAVTSCIIQQNPELVAAWDELARLKNEQNRQVLTLTPYEHFVSRNNYPTTMLIFKHPELMAKANKYSRVVICLSQQRGRLYVGNEVAADWPVSTGIPGRETPVGNYTVLEKKEDYCSNRYGKMYNESGKCINSDADIFTQQVPEGGKFVGSPMPYWMRLTWDGVGMHIGKVSAGKRLSHGCIRTPREMAIDLYKTVGFGTKVAVIDKVEAWYPAKNAMARVQANTAREKRIKELEKKIAELTPKKTR